jgi:hypothetical protein
MSSKPTDGVFVHTPRRAYEEDISKD